MDALKKTICQAALDGATSNIEQIKAVRVFHISDKEIQVRIAEDGGLRYFSVQVKEIVS